MSTSPYLPHPSCGVQGAPAEPWGLGCTLKVEVTGWWAARGIQAEHAGASDSHTPRPRAPRGRGSVPCRHLTLLGSSFTGKGQDWPGRVLASSVRPDTGLSSTHPPPAALGSSLAPGP